MKRWGSSKRLFILFLMCGCLWLAACSSGQEQASSPPQQEGQEQTAPGSENANQGELVKLRAAQPVDAISFLPVYVARHENFFADEGLSVEWVILGGGITPTQALVSGDFDFIDEGTNTLIAAMDKGQPLKMVQNTQVGSTVHVMAHPDFLKETGIELSQPLEEKLRRIAEYARQKPIKWAVSRPNSTSDIDVRNFIAQMGLTPGVEIEVVAVGALSSIAAAIANGEVQLAQVWPPANFALEVKGQAYPIIVQAKEIESHGLKPNEALAVRQDTMENRPDIVRRFVRAMNRANRYVVDHSPEELTEIVKYYFTNEDQEVLRKSVEFVQSLVPEDGRFDDEGVRLLIESTIAGSSLTPEDVSTNEFIE